MPSSILVAYITRHGSTGQVAESVGNALRETGLAVKVACLQDPMLMGDYDSVILGASLSMGRLPSDFHHFLAQNRRVLSALQPRFFVLASGNRATELDEARQQAKKELAKHSWLKAAEIQIIGGGRNVRRKGFPLSLLGRLAAFRKPVSTAIGARDEEAIRAWVVGIAWQLRSAA